MIMYVYYWPLTFIALVLLQNENIVKDVILLAQGEMALETVSTY